MKVTDTKIPDIKIIEPTIFEDERGYFFESFNHKKFEEAIGLTVTFVQDNHSRSRKGVLRGLHYQLPPHEQGKLVRVVQGEIFDVAVDIRKSSPTFGQWVGETLSAENKKQMWIPEGFAHGFLSLAKNSETIYKATNYYFPKKERRILWNDPDISVHWPSKVKLLMSNVDKFADSLKDQECC